MAEIFSENGLRLTRAGSDRVQGWMRVKELLKVVKDENGEKKTSRLHIFSACTELIRCLPAMTHDLHNPSDCSVKPHDITHVCDALRYLCSERVSPSKEPIEKTWEQKEKEKAIARSRRAQRYLD